MLCNALNWLIDSWSTENVATAPAAESTMDLVTRSITPLLQPHTSSPNISPVIACVIANLIVSDLSEKDLSQVLNTLLDSLAISPETKQGTIPALLGISNLAKLLLQGYVHEPLILSYDPKSY
jgi:hypothetical protein